MTYLDSLHAAGPSGDATINEGNDGGDSILWPSPKQFKHVGNAAPKMGLNIAKVGCYFLEHNLSVSRMSKVQKSGFAMFEEGFLNTCMFKVISDDVFLRAAVFAEMRKEVSYLVECRFNDEEIVYTNCECTAGRGPHAICKHVAVVLYSVENYERTGAWKVAKSCTDTAQSWPQQPKKRLLDPHDPKTPAQVLNMKEGEVPYLSDPRPVRLQQLDPASKRQRLEMMLVNFAATRASRLHLHEICKGEVDMQALVKDHDYLEKSLPEVWLSSAITVSQEEAVMLEQKTRGQARSEVWADERRLRLTASCSHRVCHIKKNEKGLAESIYSGASLDHIPAVRWGKVNEKHALRRYTEVTGRKVRKCGLYVCVPKPFLAATPDGVCSDRLVEVKCPYKKEIRNSESLLHAGYLPLQVDENGVATLKETHPYFYQVQLQLYASGFDVCDFVVYTPRDICIVEVTRDQPFADRMVSKLAAFYERFYKPVLVKKLFRCAL